MRKKRKIIGRMPDGSRIRLDSQDKVKDYRYELEEILDIVGHADALVTDRSAPSDFCLDDEGDETDEVLQKIGEHFGIDAPKPGEFLVDIAERAREARKGR